MRGGWLKNGGYDSVSILLPRCTPSRVQPAPIPILPLQIFPKLPIPITYNIGDILYFSQGSKWQ